MLRKIENAKCACIYRRVTKTDGPFSYFFLSYIPYPLFVCKYRNTGSLAKIITCWMIKFRKMHCEVYVNFRAFCSASICQSSTIIFPLFRNTHFRLDYFLFNFEINPFAPFIATEFSLIHRSCFRRYGAVEIARYLNNV